MAELVDQTRLAAVQSTNSRKDVGDKNGHYCGWLRLLHPEGNTANRTNFPLANDHCSFLRNPLISDSDQVRNPPIILKRRRFLASDHANKKDCLPYQQQPQSQSYVKNEVTLFHVE